MLNNEEINLLARTFKIFGDVTRIKILYSMYNDSLCVQEIAEKINMSVSAVSHQLSILRDARLVKCEKKGKEVYYTLDDDHVKKLLSLCEEHVLERGVKNA